MGGDTIQMSLDSDQTINPWDCPRARTSHRTISSSVLEEPARHMPGENTPPVLEQFHLSDSVLLKPLRPPTSGAAQKARTRFRCLGIWRRNWRTGRTRTRNQKINVKIGRRVLAQHVPSQVLQERKLIVRWLVLALGQVPRIDRLIAVQGHLNHLAAHQLDQRPIRSPRAPESRSTHLRVQPSGASAARPASCLPRFSPSADHSHPIDRNRTSNTELVAGKASRRE